MEVFDQLPFTGTIKDFTYDSFIRKCKDRNTGQFIKETKSRKRGCSCPDFIEKNNLNCESSPIQWFEAFLPNFLIENWTSYINTKALLANAGQAGKMYPDFKPFTCDELKKHIRVVLLQGISPSPRVSMKFKLQKVDFANDNDFVRNNLGPNAEHRHKHFKRFFGCQDPLKIVPPRSQYPLWKLKEFLDHINTICPKAWLLHKWIFVDEQTIGFKGKHADKLRISFK